MTLLTVNDRLQEREFNKMWLWDFGIDFNDLSAFCNWAQGALKVIGLENNATIKESSWSQSDLITNLNHRLQFMTYHSYSLFIMMGLHGLYVGFPHHLMR